MLYFCNLKKIERIDLVRCIGNKSQEVVEEMAMGERGGGNVLQTYFRV